MPNQLEPVADDHQIPRCAPASPRSTDLNGADQAKGYSSRETQERAGTFWVEERTFRASRLTQNCWQIAGFLHLT
jgi:hypothetical protein